MLEDRLPNSPHVGKNGLSEVPSEEFWSRPSSVIQETAVQECSRDSIQICLKADDLIVILGFLIRESLKRGTREKKPTSGLTETLYRSKSVRILPRRSRPFWTELMAPP